MKLSKLGCLVSVIGLFLGSCTEMNKSQSATPAAKAQTVTNESSSATSPQFGLVNIQQVILNVEEGKVARKKLEDEIRGQQAEMAKEKKSLEQMDRDFKEKMALLSNEAKQKKFVVFQKRLQDLQKKEMEFATSVKQKEQQATQKIAAKVSVLVNKIAKDKNLSAVFEATSSGLMYVQDPIELTKEVIEAYSTFKVNQLDDQAKNETLNSIKVEKK